ncbi:MAG: formyltransferase family protein [Sorangiineae bacterium]|nr:formyltransferase family protein [Polyangiaceae bacterium]MEB2322298.1 formyltransferase family protein [Sorangiineae bacterium]
MRIGFFGLPLAAYLLVEDGHTLAFAALSPIRAPGARRLRRLIGAERVLDAAELGNRLGEEVEARLGEAELIVSWFWTRRLPGAWLARAPLGAIGVHPSLLPRHRGPDPFFAAIDAGDEETGVTVHRLDASYDTGPILLAERLRIGERSAWQLARALDRPALRLLREAARRIASGAPMPEARQDESLATWAGEPEGAELRADFSWDTSRVLRRIRALAPVPGLAIAVHDQNLFVTEAIAEPRLLPALEPGEALIDAQRGLGIRTGDGGIVVTAATVGEASGLPAGTELDAAGVAALLAEAGNRPCDARGTRLGAGSGAVIDWPPSEEQDDRSGDDGADRP